MSEVQPCFQLLRIGSGPDSGSGSGSGRDLYTFRPALARCVFRLGRAEACDVTLQSDSCSGLISRLHAEIQAERDEDCATADWRVFVVDCSTHGTLVNDVHLTRGVRVELTDGDILTFGHQEDLPLPPACSAQAQNSSEFYFLFQKVRLRPQDFDAITLPKTPAFTSFAGTATLLRGFTPVSPSRKGVKELAKRLENSTSSTPTLKRSTLILSSIGSLSKLQAQPLTFHPDKADDKRLEKQNPTVSFSIPPANSNARPLAPPSGSAPSPANTPSGCVRISKSRRKSAHTVLPELEDEIQSPVHNGQRGIDRAQGEANRVMLQKLQITPTGKRRGRPRKHPVCQVFSHTLYVEDRSEGGRIETGHGEVAEPCAARHCHHPQEDTVQWVQCDDCDAWYHVACVGCNYSTLKDSTTEFHCGCQ
ncbi:TCF19 factor, partial [Polyodon spathula]|nr:TCF19 factor [Polyodon spathula]